MAGRYRARRRPGAAVPRGGSCSSFGHRALASGLLLEGCRELGPGKSRRQKVIEGKAGHQQHWYSKGCRAAVQQGGAAPPASFPPHPELCLAAGGMPAAGHPSPAPSPSAFFIIEVQGTHGNFITQLSLVFLVLARPRSVGWASSMGTLGTTVSD